MAERVPILNNDLQRISEAVSQLVNNGLPGTTLWLSEMLSLVGKFITVLEEETDAQNHAKAILYIKQDITWAALNSDHPQNLWFQSLLKKIATIEAKAKEESRGKPQPQPQQQPQFVPGTTKVAAAATALGVGGALLMQKLMQKATSADPDDESRKQPKPTKQEAAVYPDVFQPAEPQTLDDPGGPISSVDAYCSIPLFLANKRFTIASHTGATSSSTGLLLFDSFQLAHNIIYLRTYVP